MTAVEANTEPPTVPRRGRPPRAEAALTRAAIRDAALHVIDTDGIAAVSMRSVSRLLGVDAKSLYHHVASKDDLLDAVAEHILEKLQTPVFSGDLAADLRALAYEFRRVTTAHPEAATLVLTRQLTGYAALAPIEAVLATLGRHGASPEHAVHLMRALVATLVGALLREVSAGPTFGSEDPAGIDRRRHDLRASGLPEVSRAAPYLAVYDRDQEFAATVDYVVQSVSTSIKHLEDPAPAEKEQEPGISPHH
ncbi:TetR/AcrR family transcriptional regulator [Mycolicibacterium peregrinum]|uniref:TetR family transcriptional regulator n=1 Tax=Mycolicibacterium peregrinum TaxID=43304 RepID=A0A1A0VMG5_MYCPR|nr:TetR family transcriptional regulator [Mycolicibacterium peregrinum]OBB84386.1 TetR family transcriptional regulator [Mycolicibacterium peregrinum]